MTSYTKFDTPFCEIILLGDPQGITGLHLNTGEGKRVFEIKPELKRNSSVIDHAKMQIMEYFSGKRTEFNLPLNPRGTDFQKKVWRELMEIPFGKLKSYGEIAKLIGNSKAARAVGSANGQNPIPLIIPCHRVVGADGKLTGFAHGLAIKEKLIRWENSKFI